MELHDGDIIVFKDNISEIPYKVNIKFLRSNFPSSYNYAENLYIKVVNIGGKYGNALVSDVIYNNTNHTVANLYYYESDINNSPRWVDNVKSITIEGDQTINDETFINWLYENTVSGLPPRVIENMYAVVGDQIQYSFSNIGDVVGSIVNNGVLTIFTLGIFIVSLAVGLLRRIARRKNFKK